MGRGMKNLIYIMYRMHCTQLPFDLDASVIFPSPGCTEAREDTDWLAIKSIPFIRWCPATVESSSGYCSALLHIPIVFHYVCVFPLFRLLCFPDSPREA